MNLANEGLEARKKEEEVNMKKRKAEEDKTWEGMFYHGVAVHLAYPKHRNTGAASR